MPREEFNTQFLGAATIPRESQPMTPFDAIQFFGQPVLTEDDRDIRRVLGWTSKDDKRSAIAYYLTNTFNIPADQAFSQQDLITGSMFKENLSTDESFERIKETVQRVLRADSEYTIGEKQFPGIVGTPDFELWAADYRKRKGKDPELSFYGPPLTLEEARYFLDIDPKPIVGEAYELSKAIKFELAQNRIEASGGEDYTGRQADQDFIADFLYKKELLEERGLTRGAQFALGVSALVAYAVPFAATKKVAARAAAPAGRIGIKLIRKSKSRIARPLIKVGARIAAGIAKAFARSPAFVPYITKEYLKDREATTYTLTPDDKMVLSEDRGSPAKSFLKAYARVLTMIFAEQSGEEIIKYGKGLVARMPKGKKLLSYFKRILQSSTGKTSREFGRQLFSPIEFHGLVGELTEEQLEQTMIAAFNIGPEKGESNESFFKRVLDSAMSSEELAMAAAILAVPTAARAATGKFLAPVEVDYRKVAGKILRAAQENGEDISGIDAEQLANAIQEQVIAESGGPAAKGVIAVPGGEQALSTEQIDSEIAALRSGVEEVRDPETGQIIQEARVFTDEELARLHELQAMQEQAPTPPAAAEKQAREITPVETPAEPVTVTAEGVEKAELPGTIQEEIRQTPRYAVAEDNKTVIDWQTQQEVATYKTAARAQREANALNSGETAPKAERKAPLLPSEKGKTYTIRQLLNLAMQSQSKAARIAYMEGARDVVATNTDLARYASEQLSGLDITEAQRKQLIGAVAKTRTPAEKTSAIATIHRLAEKAEHAEAVRGLHKTTAYINRQSKIKKKDKGIRPEYLDKVRALTDTFVFQAPSQKTKQRLDSLKDFIDRERDTEVTKYGQEVADMLFPAKLMDRLGKIDRKPVAEMSADEVRDINNALQALMHLNQTKNRLLGERRARDAVETISSIMAEQDDVIDRSVVSHENTLREDYQNHSLARKIWSWVATTDNHDVETLVHTISGGQEGALQDNIAESLSEGRERRDVHSNESIDYLLRVLKDNNISLVDLQRLSPGFQRFFKTPRKERFKNFFRQLFGKSPITPRYSVKLAGKTKQLTMDELMDVYMHAQAKYNLRALLKDGVASYRSEIGKLTVEEIEAIVAQVEANPTAMSLIRAAQHVYENIAKPRINQTSAQLIGHPLAEEPDYWHMERFKKRGLFGAEAYSISTLESEGRLQARTGSNKPVVIRGFVTKLLNDISATSEYVGMAPAYRNIKMVLNYGEFKNKVDALGYQKERENLSSILQRTESPSYEHSSLDKVVMGLLRGLTRTALSGPNIMLGQYVSVHGYFDEMSTKYRTAEILKPPGRAEVDRLEKNWPFLKARRRGGVSSIALQDIAQTDIALRALGGKTDIGNIITSGIHAVDIRAIAKGGQLVEAEMADPQRDGKSKQYWDRQGFEPSELEKDSPEYWDAFRKRARFVVRRTQPMFDGENRSLHTSQRKPSDRMWFLFRSYIDQPLRMAHRGYTERGNGRITRTELSRRWANIMVTVMSYAVVGWLTDKVIFRSNKDWKDLLFDMFTTPLKMLTVIGFPLKALLERTVDIKLGKRPSFFKPRFDNLATGFVNRVIDSAIMTAEGLGHLGSGERYQSGPNKGKLKSIHQIGKGLALQLENIMAFYGVPAHIVRRSIQGWTQEQENKKKKGRSISTLRRR